MASCAAVAGNPPSTPPAQRSRWPYISLLPLGVGAWAPIYAGVKAQRNLWTVLGIVWTVIAVAGWVLASATAHGSNDIAGFLLIFSWVGGAATSFSIRGAYDRQLASGLLEATGAAQQRLHDREQALRLAREKPELAKEIGIGRPDRPDADSAGLVDVNNANVTALLTLPGVNGDLATEIVEAREKVGGFSSLEDCGAALDLDGALVEELRGRVVFLPRGG